MTTSQEAEKLMYHLLSEVWCHRNQNAVSKYYHPDFIGLLNGTEEYNYEDVLKRVDYSRERFENNHLILQEAFATQKPNHSMIRFTMQGFDRQEQHLATFEFMAIIEVKDHKMYRQWVICSTPYRYKDWD